MRNLRRVGAAIVLAAGAGLGAAAPAHGSTGGDAAQFLGLINSLRASHGVAALGWDSRLAGIAQSWSDHQAAAGVLAHNPSLAVEAPPGWTSLGENVGDGGGVAVLQAAFTASAPHYANMVNRAYTSVGIGVAQAGGLLWVTEDFSGGAPATPPTTPAPPPTAPPRISSPTMPRPARATSAPSTVAAPPATAAAASTGPTATGATPATPAAPVDPTIRLVLQRLQGLDQGA